MMPSLSCKSILMVNVDALHIIVAPQRTQHCHNCAKIYAVMIQGNSYVALE